MKKNLCFLTAGVMAAVAGCAAYPEEEFMDYEDLPERPYVVPVTEDDKPGRNVDDMLDMKSETVRKIAEASAGAAAVQTAEPKTVKPLPDVEGRFGSKEKPHLRKGLNAPADSILYDESAQRQIIVIRGLNVKPLDKEDEQKILDDIVASQNLNVNSSVRKNENDVKMSEPMPPRVSEASKTKEIVLKEPAPPKKEIAAPVSLKPPVLQAPQERENDFLLESLIPPERNQSAPFDEIVLKPPAFERESDMVQINSPTIKTSLLQETVAFPQGRTTLAEKDGYALLTAARAFKEQPSAVLRLVGYGKDKDAAAKRVKRIADVLSANGVPKARIVSETVKGVPFNQKEGYYVEIYLEY